MDSRRVKNSSSYLSPTAGAWSAIEAVEVKMMPTPLGMQPTEYIRQSWNNKPYGNVDSLSVSSVHDGKTLALKVSWQGVSPEGADFPDALAVAMPIGESPPLALMGMPDKPIHILRWTASNPIISSILSKGIGLSDHGPSVVTGAEAAKQDGKWHLVMTRQLGVGKNIAPLVEGRSTEVGFAVWYGANEERAGIKAFSVDWINLTLGA
ncbi:MAG: ethylbenzene dehydrogenase-related protein [Porticoccaceae bacterium]